MPEDGDIEVSRKIATRAMSQLDCCKMAPNPRNFEIFYVYASDANQPLQRAVRKIMAKKARMSSSDAERLHRKYLVEKSVATKLSEIGKGVGSLISQIRMHLKSPGPSPEEFEKVLDELSGKFDCASSSDQYEDCFQLIAETANEMKQLNETVQEKFENSQEQIDQLGNSLIKLRDESLVDSLTGAANRSYFDRKLNEAIDEASLDRSPLCLLMIDIDHFKKFNDEHGHQVGDAVLRLVASTIRSNAKGQDLVARYGGEEFAVVLPGTCMQQSIALAENIRKSVDEKTLERKSTSQVLGTISVSIGIAELKASDNANSLVVRADECLYEAKRAGRNNVICGTG